MASFVQSKENFYPHVKDKLLWKMTKDSLFFVKSL